MSKQFIKFPSRRSTVYSSKGIVASTQPLANAAGIKILERGGNCVDAAIAVSAALTITEPGSTGIGGDCFALYYKLNDKSDPKSGVVLGLNGSGRAAQNITPQDVWNEHNNGEYMSRIPYTSVLAVTVPGAIGGWFDAYEKWGSGKVTFEEILNPAIQLAEEGFPISELSSHAWRNNIPKLLNQNLDVKENPFILEGNRGPNEGEYITNHQIAECLKLIGKHGKKIFYEGPIADAIIKTTNARNHKLTLDDLKNHTSTIVEPIQLNFQDYKVWEIPPNGHGLVALIALGIIQELHNSGKINLYELKHNSSQYLHILIEACKLGFYDSDEYVTDPIFKDIPIDDLLSPKYLKTRSEFIDLNKIIDGNKMNHGIPDPKFKSDTVYLTVSDSNGEVCSFINSVYEGFGSAIVVEDYGFCLQNRGSNFNLTPGQSNCLEGGKRPYHTIIPGMITNNDGSLYAGFGNMGGFAQPVCHVQHVLNLIIFGMTPQQSIDSPRFVLNSNNNNNNNNDDDEATTDRGRGAEGPVCTPITVVQLEEGIELDVIEDLKTLGHKVEVLSGYDRVTFGRAQIIQNVSKDGKLIYAGGSDMRGDGAAVALI
ncbi:gamma-glutamyltransferase precursor, putative [Candida dubliniensis CD36]|uniref:Gamma-glutamyltranspeptidase, putative n=1 Tax=Candida dubliniensis (strain CD36 / ATCC MYA-646 / CBS 7987 / NCPF 3949 / NRRL Y-17841) TaxID=573826 RepID=B9WG43_CANDC|nr:gamma-glutamyltransferase precursor, putative [Candida dubliniensis CD36]CAX42213.1 gamma-glutamyltransferase precursor, putative [Candida dubliniensis CD36]